MSIFDGEMIDIEIIVASIVFGQSKKSISSTNRKNSVMPRPKSLSQTKTLSQSSRQLRSQAFHTMLVARVVIVEQINRDLVSSHALPLEQYDVLMSLYNSQEHKLKLYELAEVTLFTRSGITRVADRLEQAGFLKREHSATDRRVTFAVLTKKGIAELTRSMPVWEAAIDKYFGAFCTDSGAETMIEQLGSAVASIRSQELYALDDSGKMNRI
jgi:DNA-binding MarR family transcriptional regulator